MVVIAFYCICRNYKYSLRGNKLSSHIKYGFYNHNMHFRFLDVLADDMLLMIPRAYYGVVRILYDEIYD